METDVSLQSKSVLAEVEEPTAKFIPEKETDFRYYLTKWLLELPRGTKKTHLQLRIVWLDLKNEILEILHF